MKSHTRAKSYGGILYQLSFAYLKDEKFEGLNQSEYWSIETSTFL